jgi:Flp pilus assembly protein TadD
VQVSKDQALAAARKAVELDPGLGEAHAALGWVALLRELDLAAAESALKSAIQLDRMRQGKHRLTNMSPRLLMPNRPSCWGEGCQTMQAHAC